MARILYDRNIERKSNIKKSGEFIDENSGSEYYKKLMKLIPADVIAFYLTLNALTLAFNEEIQVFFQWITLLIALVGGLLFQAKFCNVFKFGQFVITGIAIVVWVYTIGGPFKNLNWYNQVYGEFFITIFTFFVPLFYNPKK